MPPKRKTASEGPFGFAELLPPKRVASTSLVYKPRDLVQNEVLRGEKKLPPQRVAAEAIRVVGKMPDMRKRVEEESLDWFDFPEGQGLTKDECDDAFRILDEGVGSHEVELGQFGRSADPATPERPAAARKERFTGEFPVELLDTPTRQLLTEPIGLTPNSGGGGKVLAVTMDELHFADPTHMSKVGLFFA